MLKSKFKTIQINTRAIKNLKRSKKNLNLLISDQINLVKNNGMLFFLYSVLILGTIVGVIFAKNADNEMISNLDFLFASNYQSRLSQSIFDNFSTSLVSSFIFILITIFMGLSMWGSVLVPIVPFFRGFGLGISSGFLYKIYGFKGILFNLILILPGMFLSCIAIVLSAKEAIKFSSILASFGFDYKKHDRKIPNIKIYFFKNSKSFILIVIGALVDMFFTICFSPLFSF